jgi:drug/metabolite transporter superfamily protein YnfA
MSDKNKSQFVKAGAGKEASLFEELFAMMKQNKKYWLAPIIIILLLFGVLITLGSSAAAPFIYSLF